jgi:hypothetical protein
MAVLTPVLLIVVGVTKQWSILLVLVLPFLAWPIGVHLATIPRQPGMHHGIDHVAEWRRLRFWTRVTQWAWPFAALLWWGIAWFNAMVAAATTAATVAAQSVAMGFTPTTPVPVPPPAWFQIVLFSLGGPVWICAFAGLPLLTLYLSRIAEWANDTELANRLLVAAWGIVAGPLLALLGWVVIPALGPKSMLFIGALFGNLGVIIFVLCFGQMGLAVFQCWNIARWAVSNGQESRARDLRIAERALHPQDIERVQIRLETTTSPAVPEHLPNFAPEYSPDTPPPPPQGRVIRRAAGGGGQPLELAPDTSPPSPRRHPPHQ